MKTTTTKKEKKIADCAIIAGIILYLSKFLRDFFNDNNTVLFLLGSLPNFGLAFAIPFIYVGHQLRLNKVVKYFPVACIVTLLLMIANEIRDKYQAGRVFDWNDIYASVVGVTAAWLVFNRMVKKSAIK